MKSWMCHLLIMWPWARSLTSISLCFLISKRRIALLPISCLDQSILKEINPEYSLEGLMVKLKFQCFGHLIQRADSLEKTLMLGANWGQEEKKVAEDEMTGWHHQLNGHEFEQTLGDGVGQASLACSSLWVAKNWTQLSYWTIITNPCVVQRGED